MNIQTSRTGQNALIAIKGDIDEAGAEELKKSFRDIAGTGATSVRVDFKEVSHIGSSGIGKLLVFYKDLSIRGASLEVVNVPHAIAELLREMKLDTLFRVEERR